MKLFVALALFQIGCGQATQENKNQPKDRGATPPSAGEDKTGLFNEIEGAILGQNGRYWDQSWGSPKNIVSAYGSFVQYRASSTNYSCAGVFSYEEPYAATTWYAGLQLVNVYFYTARHCFEKVNPLGFTEKKLSNAQIQFSSSTRFVAPFGPAQAVPAQIKTGYSELLTENGLRSDVIRIFQFQTYLSAARQAYIPTCTSLPSTTILSTADQYRLVAFAYNNGVFQASTNINGTVLSQFSWFAPNWGGTQTNTPKSGPLLIRDEFQVPESKLTTIMKLSNISAIPGESGGPVYLHRLAQSGVQFVPGGVTYSQSKASEYLCLQGVMTREMAVPSPYPNQYGIYPFQSNTYFSPFLPASQPGVKWVLIE